MAAAWAAGESLQPEVLPWGVPHFTVQPGSDSGWASAAAGATACESPATACAPPATQLDADLELLESLDPLPSSFWASALASLQPDAPPVAAGSGSGSGSRASNSCDATAIAVDSGARSRARATCGKSASTGRYNTPQARASKAEQQRQYRLRFKERKGRQAAELEAAAAAVAAARREQAELKQRQQTLLQLQECRETMAGAMRRSEAAACPAGGGSGGSATAAADDVETSWMPQVAMEVAGGAISPACVAELMDAATEAQEVACGRSGAPGAGSSEGRHAEAGAGSLRSRLAHRLLSSLPEGLWKRLLVPDDDQLREMVEGTTPARFATCDKGFRTLLGNSVDEWEVSPPAGRRRVERRLRLLWTLREKSAAVLAEHRPGLLCDLMRRHLLPAPRQQHVLGGGTAGCAVHHLLPPVVEQLALTTHQRRSILQIWQQYQHRMAAVRQRARQRIGCMQEVAGRRQALGQGAQQGGQAAARAEPPLSAVMQDYLTTFDAADSLATLPHQEAASCMHLSLALFQVLTPLQSSRLLLGCSPYIPDPTQLCCLLEGQQEQHWLGAAKDPGHLLAASSIAVA